MLGFDNRATGSVQPGTSRLNRAWMTETRVSGGLGVVVHGGDWRWQAVLAGGRCSGTHGSTGNRRSWKRKEEETAELVVKGGETELNDHSRRCTVGSGGRTDGGERLFPAVKEIAGEEGEGAIRESWLGEERERGSKLVWSGQI